MRAKKVNEVQNFTRGQDPKRSLDIGESREWRKGDKIQAQETIYHTFHSLHSDSFYTQDEINSRMGILIKEDDVLVFDGADVENHTIPYFWKDGKEMEGLPLDWVKKHMESFQRL